MFDAEDLSAIFHGFFRADGELEAIDDIEDDKAKDDDDQRDSE